MWVSEAVGTEQGETAPVPVGLVDTVYTDQAECSLATGCATIGQDVDRLTASALSACVAPADLPSISVRRVRLHAVTESQAVDHVLGALDQGRGGWVVTPNLDHVRRLAQDRKFRALYTHADLVVADGMPLVWASRLQGTPLPGRVAGSDLINSLTAGAALHGRSIYLLGGAKGTAELAAKALQEKHANLRIAGIYYPELGFDQDEAEMRRIGQELERAKPDIVYVALGSPKQEWVIGQLRGYLPKAWWLGIGISFSFVCGEVRRAPKWMQRSGLEWLHRLYQEPRRLAKRYLVDGMPFAATLLVGAAVTRFRGRLAEGAS